MNRWRSRKTPSRLECSQGKKHEEEWSDVPSLVGQNEVLRFSGAVRVEEFQRSVRQDSGILDGTV